MKLHVGDIMLLEEGMKVPADCIVISSSNLEVDDVPGDESLETKSKSPLLPGKRCDPFLYTDSLVI